MAEWEDYGLGKKTVGFPFTIAHPGRVQITGGDECLNGKIIQLLFTSPGERVHLPDFGCGLFNMIFEPNDTLLKTSLGFHIREALLRWMEEDIIVDNVVLDTSEDKIYVQIDYKRKVDHMSQSVRLSFK